MEILKKKNDNIGLVISIVVHISILFIIFFSKGCVEIQNPPQFTLEEVITIDFSDAGGGNPGSSSPVKPEINEEANSEKEITQEESPVEIKTSKSSNKSETESKKSKTEEVAKPKNDFSNVFGKGSGDNKSGNGEGEGTGIGTGKGPNTGGGMGNGERTLINTPKPENLKNWVGTVAVQFIVDKEGAVISTKVLATSKLTTINLTKSEQDFIEKDCKKKFKFSKGAGKDRFVLKMTYVNQ